MVIYDWKFNFDDIVIRAIYFWPVNCTMFSWKTHFWPILRWKPKFYHFFLLKTEKFGPGKPNIKILINVDLEKPKFWPWITNDWPLNLHFLTNFDLEKPGWLIRNQNFDLKKQIIHFIAKILTLKTIYQNFDNCWPF